MTPADSLPPAWDLFEGEADRLRGRARQYAEARHGWDSVFSQLFAIYRNLGMGCQPSN